MGRIVIACYRPKPGKAAELRDLMRHHVERLRAEDLVTDRAPIVMQAADGTVLEVFEWRSQDAIDAAHSNPVVQQMWGEYAAVCDYVPVAEIPESADLFSGFEPLDLGDFGE